VPEQLLAFSFVIPTKEGSKILSNQLIHFQKKETPTETNDTIQLVLKPLRYEYEDHLQGSAFKNAVCYCTLIFK